MKDFAKITKYLDKSNYIIISLIYNLLIIISKKIIFENFNMKVINLISLNTIFNNNIGYKDTLKNEPIT